MISPRTPAQTRICVTWIESTLEELRGLLSDAALKMNNDTVLMHCLKDDNVGLGEIYTVDRIVREPLSILGYGVILKERTGIYALEHFSIAEQEG